MASDILLMGDLHIYDLLRPREKNIYDKPYSDLRASTELQIQKTHCAWLFNHMPACLYLCIKLVKLGSFTDHYKLFLPQ